jgi:hypothetical protein
MPDPKIAALNPTVRRALRQSAVPPSPYAGPAPLLGAAELCPHCHDIGLTPAGGDAPSVLAPCARCRTGAFGLYAAQMASGQWIAVRDLPGLWGVGPCAVDALLDLERRTPEGASAFSPRYRRHAVAIVAAEAGGAVAGGQVA